MQQQARRKATQMHATKHAPTAFVAFRYVVQLARVLRAQVFVLLFRQRTTAVDLEMVTMAAGLAIAFKTVSSLGTMSISKTIH